MTARDSLEWYDGKQIAVARGDAVATRSGKTIKADILTAYMLKSAQPTAQQPRDAGRRASSPRAASAEPPRRYAAAHPRRRRARRGRRGRRRKEGESRISRVDAQGHVVVSDALNTGRGDYGVYNGDTGIATLIGNVVIQRGENVIQGQRGVMDLNNNIARMMPGSGPGADHSASRACSSAIRPTPGAAPAGDRKHP